MDLHFRIGHRMGKMQSLPLLNRKAVKKGISGVQALPKPDIMKNNGVK